MREDWLERLVLRFFEQRIFGPMRLERLAKQLRAHDREQRRNGKLAGTRIRQQIAELERKIKAQVQALEKGIEPELVSERIGELREEKQALEEALAGIGAERQEAEEEELAAQLARLPDLGQALREAPAAVKRQVFESFELRIAYDKSERRVELTATVSEAVADAFENAKALLAEGSERGSERHSGGPIRSSLPPKDRRASPARGLTKIAASHGEMTQVEDGPSSVNVPQYT